MFNEFEKNNKPFTTQNLVKHAPYLSNNERNRLASNARRLPYNNVSKKVSNVINKKIARADLSRMKISPLQTSVFNAMVNLESNPGNYNVNVTEILYKKPIKRRPIAPGSSLEIEVSAIKLLYGRMQIGAKHTFTVTPNANAKNRHRYFVAQIDGFTFEGGKKHKLLVKIYTNGKMQIAGGILNNNSRHPEMIRKYIIDKYAPRYKFLYNPMKYVTLVGTFETNGRINLTSVAKAFKKSGNINYEPELSPALKMTFQGYTYRLFTSGKIQIMGSKTMNGLTTAYNPHGIELVKHLRVMGLLTGFKNINGPSNKLVTTRKNKTVNVSNANSKITYYNKKNSKNGKNGVRVGVRKCLTVSKPKLVAVAEKMGVVDITGKTTKPQICNKIKNRVFGTYMVNNKPCLAYTKEQLTPIAVARGVPVTDGDTVDTLCKKLKLPRPTEPKKRGRKPKSVNKVKQSANVVKKMEKRRLTNKAIKEDLEKEYGKRWLKKYKNVMPSINADVAEIKKRINALNLKKNKKSGIPFKANVNKLKKDSVRTWKFERKKKLDNALNNLNNNFSKELENAMNVATPSPKKSPKGLTRFPKGTKVEQL